VKLLAAALVLLAGCAEPGFDRPEALGGVDISASELTEGLRIYTRYCVRCHGEHGDGNGPAAPGMWPPPRDFRSARFKFAGIEDRGLPADDELVRIIRGGLHGSAMLGWDLSRDEARAAAHYIKTFSPPGRGFRNPRLAVKPPIIPPDPHRTTGAKPDLLDRGSRLYHSVFQCAQCHPSYATAADFDRWGVAPPRAEAPALPVPKWSDGYQSVLLPPDFRRHPMRSVRVDDTGAANPDDLYRVIAYGLQGPMPGYGHLDHDDIWAVVHYVKSVADH
jgi:mono/diheme cytochrome c family protein